MRSILLAVLVCFSFVGAAYAERYYSRTVVRTTAQDDAEYMARTGRFGHRGCCGCREGIGWAPRQTRLWRAVATTTAGT